MANLPAPVARESTYKVAREKAMKYIKKGHRKIKFVNKQYLVFAVDKGDF